MNFKSDKIGESRCLVFICIPCGNKMNNYAGVFWCLHLLERKKCKQKYIQDSVIAVWLLFVGQIVRPAAIISKNMCDSVTVYITRLIVSCTECLRKIYLMTISVHIGATKMFILRKLSIFSRTFRIWQQKNNTV